MLEYLQKRLADTMNQTGAAILSTCNSLGIRQFPCQYWQIHPNPMRAYLLVPKTLDMLENLIANSETSVITSLWRAHGMSRVLTSMEEMGGLRLLDHSSSRWCSLVEFRPRSIQLQPYADWRDAALIEFYEE